MDPMIEKILQSLKNAGKGVANVFLPTPTAEATPEEKIMSLLSQQSNAMGQKADASPDIIAQMAQEYAGGSPAPSPEFYSTIESSAGGKESGKMASPMHRGMMGQTEEMSMAPPELPKEVKKPRLRSFVADAVYATPSAKAQPQMSDDDMEGAIKYVLKGKKEDIPDLEAAAVADYYRRTKKRK